MCVFVCVSVCVRQRERERDGERQREYSNNLNSRCLYVKKYFFRQPVSREEGAAAVLHHAASEENRLYHASFPLYHFWAFALTDAGQQNQKQLVCEVLFSKSEVSKSP